MTGDDGCGPDVGPMLYRPTGGPNYRGSKPSVCLYFPLFPSNSPCNFLPSSSFLPRARSSTPPCSVLAEAFNPQLGHAVLSEASEMEQKRKASDDAPETSRPLARMRSASADDEDVSPHGGGSGSGGEREMVPSPQPLPMAGTGANLTDSSGRIDSFVSDDGEEASSLSGNGEELAAVAGLPQPLLDQDQPVAGEELAAAAEQPQPLLDQDQPVAGAEPPQPLPNNERSVIDAVVPGPATAAMVAAEYIWCSGCLSQTASVRLVPELHFCHCVRCHFSPAGMPYCEYCDAAHH